MGRGCQKRRAGGKGGLRAVLKSRTVAEPKPNRLDGWMERWILQLDPQTFGNFYRVLTGVVVPRPIAFVSTVSPEGVTLEC